MSRSSVIVDAVRSPMGVKGGRLIGIRADDLAAQVVIALLERQPGLPKEDIEDVVLGTAFPENTQGMLMARGVSILAGSSPETAAGKVVNRFCGSSMDAVHQLSQAVLAGRHRLRHRSRCGGHVRHSHGWLQPLFPSQAGRDGLLHRHGRDGREPGQGSGDRTRPSGGIRGPVARTGT